MKHQRVLMRRSSFCPVASRVALVRASLLQLVAWSLRALPMLLAGCELASPTSIERPVVVVVPPGIVHAYRLINPPEDGMTYCFQTGVGWPRPAIDFGRWCTSIAWTDQYGIHNLLPPGNYQQPLLKLWRAGFVLKSRFRVRIVNSDGKTSPNCDRTYEIHGRIDDSGTTIVPPTLQITK